MMPERLALVDIAHVHFDDRLLERQQRIEDRDRGVGQTGAVDDQPVGLLPRLLNPVDQFALGIRLTEIEVDADRPWRAFRSAP